MRLDGSASSDELDGSVSSDEMPAAHETSFHQFRNLPAELRLMIWEAYLGPPTPRLIVCEYCAAIDGNISKNNRAVSPDSYTHGFLNPWYESIEEGTEPDRTLSATCWESHMTVARIYPDKLTLPHAAWDSQQWEPPAKGTVSVLRYSAARDIFMLRDFWDTGREVEIRFALPGNLVDDQLLAKIRHLGVWDIALTGCPGQIRPFGCSHGHHHRCSPTQCPDACVNEALPRLVKFFPALETFYIVDDLPEDGVDIVPDGHSALNVIPTAVECCGHGSEKVGAPPLKHVWPTARPIHRPGYCVVYDELAGCYVRETWEVKEIRQIWRAHFPYYQALSHLKIKFMKWVDPWTADAQYWTSV